MNPLARWSEFAQAVRNRLEKGRAEYGDASFERPPEELAAEIEEELADVCGWAFVLWCRVRALGERLPVLTADRAKVPPGTNDVEQRCIHR